ncbi:hypothetical protein [Propionivibrio sp.]|uniref:hypothetical protein n=1 Tax=Propionivibrio sp. TaxID=2212460 RepID=UPI0025F01F57|nr:hypothetical protein [Propionivibrio sp.]MBK7355127.1 hypothetical protein [Propionivibrio sp.]
MVSAPPVWKGFLLSSIACCVLVIAPPFKSVSPWALTWKPWSPARIADCSLTLA